MAKSGCQVSFAECVHWAIPSVLSFPEEARLRYDAAPASYSDRWEQVTHALTSSTRDSILNNMNLNQRSKFKSTKNNDRPNTQGTISSIFRWGKTRALSPCRQERDSRLKSVTAISRATPVRCVYLRPRVPVSAETSVECAEWHAGICVLLWFLDSCVCVPCYPEEMLIKGLSSVSVTELKAGERNYSIPN